MTLVTITDPRSPASEAYRALRTNLSFYSLDKPLRTLIVTSPAAGEGKSTTAANLAVTMAQSGRRTILVDCDLRRPTLHELFGLPMSPGLTNVVMEEGGELPLQQTAVDNLWLLSSGPKPPNPADMLGALRMEQIIAQLAERAEMVLFDAPPVMAASDATILGAKTDGVLLVVQAGKTRRDHSERGHGHPQERARRQPARASDLRDVDPDQRGESQWQREVQEQVHEEERRRHRYLAGEGAGDWFREDRQDVQELRALNRQRLALGVPHQHQPGPPTQ